jgi:hypothetical protein
MPSRISHSRGPSNPASKPRSASNAVRHEFLDPVVGLRFQQRDVFRALHEAYIQHFQPAGTVESRLVEEMAVTTWRTRRCWAVEKSILEAKGSAHAPIATLRSGLRLIRRYEERLSRNFERALDNLVLLRLNTELPNEPNPIFGQPQLDNTELPNEPNPVSEHGPGEVLATGRTSDTDPCPLPEADTAPLRARGSRPTSRRLRAPSPSPSAGGTPSGESAPDATATC